MSQLSSGGRSWTSASSAPIFSEMVCTVDLHGVRAHKIYLRALEVRAAIVVLCAPRNRGSRETERAPRGRARGRTRAGSTCDERVKRRAGAELTFSRAARSKARLCLRLAELDGAAGDRFRAEPDGGVTVSAVLRQPTGP